ncbi:MAG: hypothetical protein WC378_05550 [Opitutaceae bacterium]|jgi:hypothetical protein
MEIEEYSYDASGYCPVLVRDGWQIGHLNFMPALCSEAIDRVERHKKTDEVFILIRGGASLIAATETPAGLTWEVQQMRPGVTYNIPTALWHAIAMAPDNVVLIVEKNDTHLNDVEYRGLTDADRLSLSAALNQPPLLEQRP